MSIFGSHKSDLGIIGSGLYVFRHYGGIQPEPITYNYTGNSTESTITSGGTTYTLLTLTSDGVLTFNKSVTVDIWACGGGSNGLKASSYGSYWGAGTGGAGAYCAETDNVDISTINVTIGAANTASGTIITGDTSLTALGVSNNRNGGTGGGGAKMVRSSGGSLVNANAGSGDGKSKYPFGDTTNFDPHCAGGGGGNLHTTGGAYYKGGNGGTNGGNGTANSSGNVSSTPGTGGNKGGGRGGYSGGQASSNNPSNGTNASFYGSGGGGGGGGTYSGGTTSANGGSGYQGVCYVRFEESQTPPTPVSYTITWLNYDNSVISTSTCESGNVPIYNGNTPTKPSDGTHNYNFTGWSPTIVPATGNTTYTAQYIEVINPSTSLYYKVNNQVLYLRTDNPGGYTDGSVALNAINPADIPWENDKANIIEVVFLTGLIPTRCNEWFSDCQNLTTIDNISELNTSNTVELYRTFADCYSLTNLDVSGFDTSNVTLFTAAFYGCMSLSDLDVSNFDTSNATDMYQMFAGCSSLTRLDLSSFNTSNVTNMGSMFEGCSSLTYLDLSSFDMSKVRVATNMFRFTPNVTTAYCKDAANKTILDAACQQSGVNWRFTVKQ